MKPLDPATLVRLRIWVVSPPHGDSFAVQRGRADLLLPSAIKPDSIQFDFTLRVGTPQADGSFNFLGEFAQGSPTDRFVYINSGQRASQPASPWTRRAKLKLAGIPAQFVAEALGKADRLIEARITGTMKDGSPICASVPSKAVIWTLIHDVD